MNRKEVVVSRAAFYLFASVALCIASFLTVLVLNTRFSSIRTVEVEKDYIIGPIEVSEKQSTLRFQATRNMHVNGNWISVQADVLNENKGFLFSVSDELWYESGRDSEGPWSEAHDMFDAKFTLGKGKYYIAIQAEYSSGMRPYLFVRVSEVFGATSLLLVVGIVSGFAAVIIFIFKIM